MMKQLGCPTCLVLMAVACGSAPPRSLLDARAAYQQAATGPAARRTPAQLHVAQTSLMLAEQTYSDEGDSQRARDRAYVAMRKAQLAEVQAATDEDNERAAHAENNAEQIKRANELATQQDLNRTKAELASEQQRRLDAERAAAEAMSKLANVASVKQESRGTVITLSGSVIFASGKADLLPSARAKLSQVAAALKHSEPGAKFEVNGYTDSRGSLDLNQELSTRRAAAVRTYLITQGVPEDRIVSQGLGPNNPVADNNTAEGRANNRRVEIVVKGNQPNELDRSTSEQRSQSQTNPQPSQQTARGNQQQSSQERRTE